MKWFYVYNNNTQRGIMFTYVIKRVFSIAISIIIVTTLLYVLLHASMSGYWGTAPFKDNVFYAWGDFKVYVSGIVNDFDFGKSLNDEDVWALVWPKFKLSMLYNLTALAIFVPTGIVLGVIAAVYKNKTIDVIISSFAMIFTSIPAFLLIFFLVIYVGYGLRVLPPIAPAYSAPLHTQILGFIIPVFALSAGPIGKIAQIVRGELLEIMNSEHFLLARAKGLTRRTAILRHGLRESMITVIPEIIPTFMLMIGFSFVVEQTYNIFGVSKLLFDAMIVPGEYYNTLNIDVPVVVVIGGLLYTIILIASLFTDILITLVDPRIHMIKTKKGKLID